MIKLFTYEGYTVNIEPEALLLEPFKAIWNRDKSKDKFKAKQELGFVYFMSDPRSDYQFIVDEEVRMSEIKKGEGLPANWKPDEVIKRAMTFYESFKPSSASLLEDTRVLVDKFRSKLRELDFEELEIKDLKELTAMVKQLPDLIKSLDEAEKALTRDIQQESKARGSQAKAVFEDED